MDWCFKPHGDSLGLHYQVIPGYLRAMLSEGSLRR